jgi:chromate transporter
MTLLLQLLGTFAVLSLLAIGGANSALPEMHRQLVDLHGWLDGATFAELYALAQAAPGPNILVASVMGWWIAGAGGLVVATLGMLVPPAVLAWGIAGLTHRLRHARWLRPAQAGLVPLAIGLLLAAGLLMAGASEGDGKGGWLGPAIVAAAAAVIWRTGWSPMWVLAAGGLIGLLLPPS